MRAHTQPHQYIAGEEGNRDRVWRATKDAMEGNTVAMNTGFSETSTSSQVGLVAVLGGAVA